MPKERRKRTARKATLGVRDKAAVDKCVRYFEAKRHLFQHAADSVVSVCKTDPELKKFIHFIKYRLKDSNHLRAKLRKRALEDKKDGKQLTINEGNLFQKITDLAGVRILHLHTDQIAAMHGRILAILKEGEYRVEKAVANIWDNESEARFGNLGFEIVSRETMYTSVHYDIEFNKTSGVRCELQVRTLAEELWAEVSHTVNYPEPTASIACQEQLKVLARVASGCTRLVDSIFRSREEFERQRASR